jgi:hypothetical protein
VTREMVSHIPETKRSRSKERLLRPIEYASSIDSWHFFSSAPLYIYMCVCVCVCVCVCAFLLQTTATISSFFFSLLFPSV